MSNKRVTKVPKSEELSTLLGKKRQALRPFSAPKGSKQPLSGPFCPQKPKNFPLFLAIFSPCYVVGARVREKEQFTYY